MSWPWVPKLLPVRRPSTTICITCRLDRESSQRSPRSDGIQLAELVEEAARNRPAPPDIVRHVCLWACAQACAILAEADGKTGYIAGRFEPTPVAAAARPPNARVLRTALRAG